MHDRFTESLFDIGDIPSFKVLETDLKYAGFSVSMVEMKLTTAYPQLCLSGYWTSLRGPYANHPQMYPSYL